MLRARFVLVFCVAASAPLGGCAFLFDTQALSDGPADAAEPGPDAREDDRPSLDARDGEARPGTTAYPQVVLDDGPVAYFRLGEGVGTIAPRDEVGSGPAAELVGGVVFGAAGLLVGDPDGAAHFDGELGTLFIGAADRFDFADVAPFTLEAWISPDVIDEQSRRLFSNENNSAVKTPGPAGWQGYFVVVQTIAAGGVSFVRATDGATCGDGNRGETPAPRSAHHVVASYTGKDSALWIDGVRQASPTGVCGAGLRETGMRLGVGGPGNCFRGTIDEVAIYDKALDEARVLRHLAVGQGRGGGP